MNTDGNLESLRRYERDIDNAEVRSALMEERLRDAVEPLVEEAESMFNDIQREFGIYDGTFLDFIKEL